MKDYSAAQIKKRIKVPINQFPKEGSKIRKLYDLFYQYKGHSIDFGNYDRAFREKYLPSRMQYLRVFYGMNLVHQGKGRWCFAGEYIGALYVSYEQDRPLKIKLKGNTDEQSTN